MSSYMSSVVTFIGWHDSGKTTLVKQVVAALKKLGYRVAVIKSSNDSGIQFDTPGTDTFMHKEAGAESVMLVAPDQMVLQTINSGLSLRTLAHRYFPDVDIVIGEGFKRAKKIPKIEVFRDLDQKLRDEVQGVIAVATNLEGIDGNYVFRLDEAAEIALFIEKRFITRKNGRETTVLLVNGNKIPIKDYIQEVLAGTVHGFVKTLKLDKEISEIELRIKIGGAE
ncbi:molybdopterin-guanine dinucleotide biosynthesis protein B [Desulfopila sp. IMCC35006]|uniref:molybdopterin-guanine dinucleotide biosynthesis protein B n=1 Tax=Desulfopila sp. IMCC35006 TaxID=2569542 RepID=UPI001F114557|nr:molybdopterin-guanine dinucleotide biosynthesis protein B [Desulfopila sp. IMCC35006]